MGFHKLQSAPRTSLRRVILITHAFSSVTAPERSRVVCGIRVGGHAQSSERAATVRRQDKKHSQVGPALVGLGACVVSMAPRSHLHARDRIGQLSHRFGAPKFMCTAQKRWPCRRKQSATQLACHAAEGERTSVGVLHGRHECALRRARHARGCMHVLGGEAGPLDEELSRAGAAHNGARWRFVR